MKFDSASLIRRVDRAVFVRVGDEFLALDGEARECFSLNATSMAIWEMLDVPATVAAICDRLTTVFAVSASQCTADVTALLAAWLDAGLIEVVDVPRA